MAIRAVISLRSNDSLNQNLVALTRASSNNGTAPSAVLAALRASRAAARAQTQPWPLAGTRLGYDVTIAAPRTALGTAWPQRHPVRQGARRGEGAGLQH